jgi:hypothetical protein
MKCHYVPQFYLKEFIEETPPEGHEPYLWVYDFAKAQWKKKAPKNIDFEINLYAFIEDPQKISYEIETAFSNLECEMASILKERIKTRQCLSDYERAVVAEFVAIMMTRTVEFKDRLDNFISKIASKFLQMYVGNPPEFRFLIEKYKRETGKDFPEINENVLSNIDIQTSRDFLLGMMIAPISEIKKCVYLMNWSFVFSRDNFFITSDSPF